MITMGEVHFHIIYGYKHYIHNYIGEPNYGIDKINNKNSL